MEHQCIVEYVCSAQRKRNIKLDTLHPCNNCIYHCWDIERACYICQLAEKKEGIKVEKIVTY